MAKIFLELLLFSTGYLLGGPVGVGTLAFLGLVGPLIQPLMIANNKLFNFKNYGLDPPKTNIPEVQIA